MLFLALQATARGATIHLFNSDQLSGTIVRLEENHLILETEYAGRIKILKDKIQTILCDEPLTIHFESGEVLHGTVLADSNGAMTLQCPAPGESTPLHLENVAAINPTPPQWTGDIILGGNLKSGNTDRTGFSIGMNARRKEIKNRFDMSFLYKYAKEEGDLSARNAYGKLKYDYFVTQQFYTYLSSEFLYDKFKDLRLRTVVGPGAGYQIWDDEIKALGFEAGMAFFNEDLDQGDDASWITGRLAGNFRYTFADILIFSEKLVIYPNLENSGDYSLRNEASISAPLAFGWALNLTSIIERNSDPEPGVTKIDSDLLLGLQYSY